MRAFRLFVCLLRWDVLREMRRRETVLNMILFALLVLYVAHLGVGPDRATVDALGPIAFWMAVLFAGTVGLSQTFAAEREGNALGGIVTAPVDLGVFYLAKVAAAWLYVMIMEVFTLGAYSVLFNFSPLDGWWGILIVLGLFTLAYVALGVVLAAMTTTLRGGGEVLLRILLIPLMIPLIVLTLEVTPTVFGVTIANGALGPPLGLGKYLAVAASIDIMYLIAGYLVFPKVIEE